MFYFHPSLLLFGQKILSAAFTRASLEGHKTNAQYGGRASPSDSTFHPLTTRRYSLRITLKISAELDCIYSLHETALSVT